MLETLVIDPTIEDPGNVPLDLLAAPYVVTRFATPTPPLDIRWGEPVDADGEPIAGRRYRNRRITIELEIVAPPGPTRSADAQAALAAIAAKVAKINREGGTLRRVLPSGDPITFDLLAQPDEIDPSWDIDWDTASVIRLQLGFIAKPFARGDEEARSVHRETTLPALVFTETAIAGDAPALGRLVATDLQGADQRWVVWGLQVLSYDAAATAAPYYAASGRTAFAGSLFTGSYRTILSTQATGGGAHLTHVGDWRVLASIARGSATGDLTMALEWATGDILSFVRNSATVYPVGDASGTSRILDLGVVSIPADSAQWEGRLVAKSTVDGDAAPTPNWLLLVPAERSGEIQANYRQVTPSTISAIDSGSHAAGGLAGVALPVGGVWQSAGSSSTDYTTGPAVLFPGGDTPSIGRDTAFSDATTHIASGRIATASAPRLTGTFLSCDLYTADINKQVLVGIAARYADINNFLGVYIDRNSLSAGTLVVAKRIAGVDRTIASIPLVSVLGNLTATLWLTTSTAGELVVYLSAVIGGWTTITERFTVYDTDLATGGALAAGTVGLLHRAAVASTCRWRNLLAYPLALDAAIYARCSAEVRYDRVARQNQAGTTLAPAGIYYGDYLTIPPSGMEGRTARFVVKASRGVPDSGPDPATDDISAQLFLTPRYLVVP